MAARLKQRTGIDPLTISQTMCQTDGPAPVLASGAVLADDEFRAPYTDILVGHAAVEFIDGRPAYRYADGAVSVDVPSGLLPDESAVLIEARPTGADDDVVPADRLFLRPGETLPLILAPGTYDVRSFDKEGPLAGPVELTVGE